MINNILEILMVVVLAGIATYDTLKSRRKDSTESREENRILDTAG
jgi:hypothetical protein